MTRLAALALLLAFFAGPAAAEDLPEIAALEPGWTTLAPGGETSCALGTPFEFHVKPGREDRLFVFLNGGGACWSGTQCDLETEPTPYFSSSQIEQNDPRHAEGVFDGANAENPLKDWTQVFVGYCTGDVHLGNRDVTYESDSGKKVEIHHRGRTNVRAVLDWVYANVKAPERVFVAGSSAGGIAAPWYAAEIATQYPDAGISVLGDGAGGYRDPAVSPLMENWGFWDDAPGWVTDGGRPASFEDIWRRAAKAEPRLTLAQFDNAYDETQEMFLMLLGTKTRLQPLVAANRADLAAAIPGFRSYVAGGTVHTLLRYNRLYTYEVEGVRAVDWLRALADGEEMENVTCGEAADCEGEPGKKD